jgi:hypothetical protein
LDGAYKHYPHLKPTSPPEQEQAVVQLCAKRNVELISTAAIGATETEKRTMLFDLAYQAGATPTDWLFVQDGDQTITGKQDLKPLLANARHDVFDTMGLEYDESRFDDITRRRWVRQTFRAVPGLHVDPICHWRYLDAQGRVIWGYNSIPSNGDLPILIHNDSTGRGHKRTKGRNAYYHVRAAEQIERDERPTRCYYCDQPPTEATNTDIHFDTAPDGNFGMSHRRTLFTCARHKRRVEYDNTYALAAQQREVMQTRPDLAVQWRDMMMKRQRMAA